MVLIFLRLILGRAEVRHRHEYISTVHISEDPLLRGVVWRPDTVDCRQYLEIRCDVLEMMPFDQDQLSRSTFWRKVVKQRLEKGGPSERPPQQLFDKCRVDM